MMSRNEALKKQKEIQKKQVIRFIICSAVIISAAIILYVSVQKRAALITLAAVTLVSAAFSAFKIYEFFKPEIMTGKVIFIDIFVSRVKKNLSNIPGERYRGYDAAFLTLKIKDEKGRVYTKTFDYLPEYQDIKEGDVISFYRFIEEPIR